MSRRALLALLITVATIGFIVGTTIERSSGHHESATETTAPTSESHRQEGTPSPGEGGGESAERHAARGGGTAAPAETHAELKPFGIDVEAAPFVALAAIASLSLAAVAWWRPRWLPWLVLVVLSMVAFAVLDIREISHQNDEGRTGLAVLAGVLAALHLGAGLVAALMARDAMRTQPGASGPRAAIGA